MDLKEGFDLQLYNTILFKGVVTAYFNCSGGSREASNQ
jgi:hypothetical protein